ncbi:hypothetical protein [Mesorhizobium sp. WSM3626]|uniref:hypothetical protein n=1 Tax=Mesorhizobium sp. WSM3626 TaxID=1040987 RepID=UPI0012EB3450|nr:hypothetical protein [Mesorhizobium sp. WSM3626]
MAEADAFAEAHVSPSFHYIAYREDQTWNLFRGRLFLSSDPDVPLKPTFSTPRIRVGEFRLANGKEAVRDVFEEFCAGQINTPDGPLALSFDETQRSRFIPFHEEGIAAQNRLSVLIIEPTQMAMPFAVPDVDWELRSAEVPFDNVGELSTYFNMGFPQSRGVVFEMIANPVAWVVYASPISGKTASPTVQMSPSLDPASVSLGIRIESGGRVVERYVIPGAELSWSRDGNFLRGVKEIPIPEGALVQCIVRYRDRAVHFAWIRDQNQSQNIRRVVFETFDPQSSILADFLFADPGKSKSMRSSDFEQAVAWLLGYLGFSVAHLGNSPRMTDGPDVLAFTPQGRLAVIECTTGLLRTENKLANLVARVNRVKEALRVSIHSGVKPLPVIVTSRTREEIAAEVETAEQLGVFVVTREGLLEALNVRSPMQPDADRMFVEAEKYLAAKRETAAATAIPNLATLQ